MSFKKNGALTTWCRIDAYKANMEQLKTLKISNNLGLHARAASKIVALAGEYQSKLFLRKDNKEADGSSILSILTLSCPKGTEVGVRIVGEDSEKFMEDLTLLFTSKFGEEA
jgi:phosphocarrier protein HPr